MEISTKQKTLNYNGKNPKYISISGSKSIYSTSHTMCENGTINRTLSNNQHQTKLELQRSSSSLSYVNNQSQQNGHGGNVNQGQNSSSAIEEKELPSEITFEKRSIPKSRTQSVQSVLSSVSLRSFVQNNHIQQAQQAQAQLQQQQQQQGNGAVGNSNKAFIASQHNSSAKLVDTSSYIQAPATAASSKRRASFEIGQRLPFNKDNKDNKDDAVESDGELEINEEQKKLTDDALRRLSSFSKFQPAEVDLTPQEPVDTHEQVLQSSTSINSTSQTYMNNYHSRQNSTSSQKQQPQLQITTSHSNSFHRPSSSPLLSRKPQINPSPAAQLRDSKQSSFTTLNQLPKQQQQQQFQQLQQQQQQHLQSQSFQNNNKAQQQQQNGSQHQQQNGSQQPLRPAQMSKSTSTSSQRTIGDTSSLRTINDPKRPMYLPAVLRQSPTNLTPEDLKFINELKSKKLISTSMGTGTSPTKTSSSYTTPGSSLTSSHKTPTKSHWKKDDYRDGCALCSKKFTFFERRHHCRRCGDLYCSEHLSNHIALAINAKFTMDFKNGIVCKVCDLCLVEYEGFIREKLGNYTSLNEVNIDENNEVSEHDDGNNGNNHTQVVNGVAVNGNTKGNNKNKKDKKQFDSFVGSIPADWSWSSF